MLLDHPFPIWHINSLTIFKHGSCILNSQELLCFDPFLPSLLRLIVVYIKLFITPHSSACIPIECYVVYVVFADLSCPLAFHSELARPIVCSLVDNLRGDIDQHSSWIAAADTMPVAEAFVMVSAGFGGDWTTILRLPTTVEVVEIQFLGRKWQAVGLVRLITPHGRKRHLHSTPRRRCVLRCELLFFRERQR